MTSVDWAAESKYLESVVRRLRVVNARAEGDTGRIADALVDLIDLVQKLIPLEGK